MPNLTKGQYNARIARTKQDLQAAQALRYDAFVGDGTHGYDCDAYDDICTHILVEDAETGTLVCCLRVLLFSGGGDIGQSYSAQFYDLSGLTDFRGQMVEIGRFCVRPGQRDPDVLRAAWGGVTRYVDENEVEMLFGCSSFRGTDAGLYLDTFKVLKGHHLAPSHWMPRVKASSVFQFAQLSEQGAPDQKQAIKMMPPLLRTYLLMGGWVSDHAVIDRQLNTLHVFTGLEIAAIPSARKRLLRTVASSLDLAHPAG